MGEERGREVGDDFHRVLGRAVLKVHIAVSKCAFTARRATIPCAVRCKPPSQPTAERYPMLRRRISFLVLVLTSFALAACADATGPTPSEACAVVAGSTKCE